MNNQSSPKPYWLGLIQKVVTFITLYNIAFLCLLGTVILVSIIGWIISLANPPYSTELQHAYGDGQNQLMSISVDGMIVGSEVSSGDFFASLDQSMTSGYEIKDKLMAAANDEYTHGVILEINSPGGTIYGARAIADGVKYYKEKTNRPVYAYIQGMGLSGAYWGAISADKVFADYGSDIGSVGVIMGPFEYYDKVLGADGGLLNGGIITQNGIETTTITAGKSKDLGNPNRRLTSEEIASLQKSANNEYDQFVSYVAGRRQLDESVIRNQIGAMSYDSKTAKELKLVDEIGSRDAAYAALAKKAGVGDDFYVVREVPLLGPIEQLFSAKSKEDKGPQVSASLCGSRKVMAYSGNMTSLCKVQ